MNSGLDEEQLESKLRIAIKSGIKDDSKLNVMALLDQSGSVETANFELIK